VWRQYNASNLAAGNNDAMDYAIIEFEYNEEKRMFFLRNCKISICFFGKGYTG
jgi:hypothetical protein